MRVWQMVKKENIFANSFNNFPSKDKGEWILFLFPPIINTERRFPFAAAARGQWIWNFGSFFL